MSSFKLGDWVISTKYPKANPIKIQHQHAIDTGIFGTYTNTKGQANLLYSEECMPWQPKVSEWCWFINTNCAPLLAQFVKMQNQSFWINNEYKSVLGYKANKFGHYSGNIGPKDEDYVFVYCEPFIGQLPTSIKDQS